MENFPSQFENSQSERERQVKEIVELAKELSERQEGFPFPGINSQDYATLKAVEEQYPGYATPVDELLERFNREGMKVVLGPHPDSGNVFILPIGSDDIENDSIFPRHLKVNESMYEKLKKLIFLTVGQSS